LIDGGPAIERTRHPSALRTEAAVTGHDESIAIGLRSLMNVANFLDATLRNPLHGALLDEIAAQRLPDAWIVAGCLTQTAWNVLTGRAVDHGINDYDIFYFDPDLSWDAEDRVIASFRAFSERQGARIESDAEFRRGGISRQVRTLAGVLARTNRARSTALVGWVERLRDTHQPRAMG
jgi:hypothetical protein